MRPLVSTRQSVVRRSDLRPLNAPSPLRVQADDQGRIVSVWRQGRLTPRKHPIARSYYELLLDDGTMLTVYHDLLTDVWFEQRA